MKRSRLCNFCRFWVGLLVLFPIGISCQSTASQFADGSRQGTASALPKARFDQSSQTPKPALSDFAWLEGKWQGAWGPRVAEQTWTAPKAGQMLGLFRVVENDKTIVIELFSLFETPDGVELRFRHFTPALVPWEQSGVTRMKLISLNAQNAVFENPADGQPKREVFTRIDPDNFTSKSEVVPEAGTTHVTEIRYHRQK